MDCKSTTSIVFSPTGTTRTIVQAIAGGLGLENSLVDMTMHSATAPLQVPATELAIIGAPVYAGRVAPVARERIKNVTGKGGPAVLVVVYGNRAYEDALLELADLAQEAGFKPLAAGAFIGEHSFSSAVSPIGVGRPDAADIDTATAFGVAIRSKLEEVPQPADIAPLEIQGNYPYREGVSRSGISPETREEDCVRCGVCVEVCPVDAITMDDLPVTDGMECIRCCACIKNCQTGARVMIQPKLLELAASLSERCATRKEPEVLL